MQSLQEVSDRLEIQQLMIDYSTAIDTHDFDILDNVFTPDAFIDYTAMGGIKGQYPEIKAWLKPSLARFGGYQHMLGNVSIKLDGDTATSKVICFNPMTVQLADGTSTVMFLGLWYLDRHVRTARGWRIAERIEERSYGYNVPAGLDAG